MTSTAKNQISAYVPKRYSAPIASYICSRSYKKEVCGSPKPFAVNPSVGGANILSSRNDTMRTDCFTRRLDCEAVICALGALAKNQPRQTFGSGAGRACLCGRISRLSGNRTPRPFPAAPSEPRHPCVNFASGKNSPAAPKDTLARPSRRPVRL